MSDVKGKLDQISAKDKVDQKLELLQKSSHNTNKYPNAGEDAQPGVKKEIEKFRKLPPEERSKQPLLYWLLGEGTPDFKMAKKDALYTDKTKVPSQKCSNCMFAYTKVVTSESICSQISGKIKPEAWCRLWRSGEE